MAFGEDITNLVRSNAPGDGIKGSGVTPRVKTALDAEALVEREKALQQRELELQQREEALKAQEARAASAPQTPRTPRSPRTPQRSKQRTPCGSIAGRADAAHHATGTADARHRRPDSEQAAHEELHLTS